MKLTGLLTAAEARACIEAGYTWLWISWGPPFPRFTHSDFFVTAEDEAFNGIDGFLPLPGALLPMEAAPRDGRRVILYQALEPLLVRVMEWCAADKVWIPGVLGDYFAEMRDSDFLGWTPLVAPQSDPE